MKTKYLGLFLIASTWGLSSCDLNVPPISHIAEDFFFQSTTEVNTAVIGCYGGMQAPLSTEWVLTEMRSDNTRMEGASSSTETNLQKALLDQALQNSNNQNIREYWQAVYKNINNCNTVLREKNLGAVTDENLRRQFEGEARFIRAYHYFNLVRLFGPILLVDKNLEVEESLLSERASVERIYNFILSDLKRASECLEGIIHESSDNGRATQVAAKTLLSKVYLTKKMYGEAKTILEEIIAVKGNTLTIPYKDIFDINKEMNSEIIFAVRFLKGNKGLGSPFANMFAPLNSGTNVIIGGGDGQNYPTNDLISSYTTGDLRKDISLAEFYIDPLKNPSKIEKAHILKFLSQVAVRYDAENDFPILRYADVLLMYAEVINENSGPTSDAIDYLNKTRVRAGLTPLSQAEVPTRYAFRQALDKERRLEFAFENQRWFDLLRHDNATEVITEHIKNKEWSFYSTFNSTAINTNVQEYQLLLPIPQSVIDINPSVITQNPYY